MSRKQARALIYVLAATRQPVPRDRLVFLFWPDKPEITARRNLSRVTSYIRNELPHPELIQVNQESIGLNPDLVWSDAARFTELAEQSSPARREEMVSLYDGSFLSGFSLPSSSEFDFWLTSQQQLYEGRYLNALKDLIQIKFAEQDLSKAIHYAQRYLTIDELAEDVHQQLIRLYTANGDRSAALRQFEACTLKLERELGVEPLPETWAAYEAARSPGVKPRTQMKTQPSWTVLPSLDLPLIGRQEAWEALEDAYRQFQRGGVIFIRGEPGIGKSRLLQEFATGQDRVVLSGNCHASTQTLPYQPLTEALREALSQPQLWAGIRPIWLSEASRILPELGEHFPDLPQAIAVEPEQAQARLYEALAQCMLGIAANAPTLLCLDDLQWADEATLGWLSHLSGRLAGSGVCILGAYRTAGASAIAGLRESFTRMDLLAEVALSGLSLEAIVSILEGLPAPLPQPRNLAARIRDATGGNPFFVLETIRAMLESDQLASLPETLPLAESVQEAILGRLAKLSPVARQVLEAAAVLAPDLDQPLLQETAGRAEFEVANGLDELVGRQMLTDSEPPRLCHDLLTQVTYQNLTPWRRRLLHLRAAEALAELYRGQEDEAVAQIAAHYDAAGAYEQAVEFYRLAAVAARQRYAQDEAITYLERAIDLAAELRLAPQRLVEIHELLGECLAARGDFEAARRAYGNSLGHLPAGEHIHRAIVQRKLARTLIAQRQLEEAEKASDTALAFLGPGPAGRSPAWQSAWLDILLARLELLYFQYKLEQLDELLRQIKPVLDEIGTTNQYVAYYAGQLRLLDHKARFALTGESVRIAERGLGVLQDTGDEAAIAYAKFGLGFHSLWAGDLQAAAEPLRDGLELAEETGVAMTQCLCLIYLCFLYRLQGDIERARAIARRGLESAQRLDIVIYIAAAQAHLAWLDWWEQEMVTAERGARKALAVWDEYPYPFKWSAHWVLCAIYLERGQLAGAVESARAMLHPFQQRLPDDVTAALEESVHRWEMGDVNSAQNAIQKAVKLAEERGYL